MVAVSVYAKDTACVVLSAGDCEEWMCFTSLGVSEKAGLIALHVCDIPYSAVTPPIARSERTYTARK